MVRRRKSRLWLRLRYWIADHPRLWLVMPLVLLGGLFLIFILTERNLKPAIMTIAKEKATVVATEAIHRTVNAGLAKGVHPKDLIEYQTDQQGRIVLLQSNAARINQVASETAIAIQGALKQEGETRFDLPLGQILGSNLLASIGPKVPIQIKPIGTVSVTPEESFEEAGINQTKHTVFLHVVSTVYIVVPFIQEEIKVAAKVPVTTSIIPGSVPNVFMGGNTGGMPPIAIDQNGQ